jgi:endonuclease/exonuclease/phosphatase family metal-dependent hydrolase
MKIAAFNVENLFERAAAFNKPTTAEAQVVLRNTARLNELLEQPSYAGHEAEILQLLANLGLDKSDRGNDAVQLRKIRGALVKRPRDAPIELVAEGRGSWIGWVEPKKEPVNEIAVDNTGRVIRDVNADILAVIEADNRPALNRFSRDVLQRISPQGVPYEHVMLIDGNDERGIDVGLMTRGDFPVRDMRSHIYDVDDNRSTIFSRDCPEYAVETKDGEMVWVLPNHFKSKFGGNSQSSRDRRKAQATRTAEIYETLRNSGEDLIVVLGDFNDTPDAEELHPLLQMTDLEDVGTHPDFDLDAFPGQGDRTGTYGLGRPNQKLDYLLLSPALFERITACGLFRRGAWPGVSPKRWVVYPELVEEIHVASDHHVIWAEIGD